MCVCEGRGGRVGWLKRGFQISVSPITTTSHPLTQQLAESQSSVAPPPMSKLTPSGAASWLATATSRWRHVADDVIPLPLQVSPDSPVH